MEITVEQLNDTIAAAVQRALPERRDPAADLNSRFLQDLEEVLAKEEAKQMVRKAIAPPAEDKPEDDEEDASAQQHARMNPVARTISSVDGALGQGIPWASAGVGGAVSLFVSEVIDGLQSPVNADGSVNLINVAMKLGGAWAAIQFGDDLVGSKAAMFTAGFLVFAALSPLLKLDQAVAWLRSKIQGLFSGFTGGNRFSGYQDYPLDNNYSLQNQSIAGYLVSGESMAGRVFGY